jgi:hypothetical protein
MPAAKAWPDQQDCRRRALHRPQQSAESPRWHHQKTGVPRGSPIRTTIARTTAPASDQAQITVTYSGAGGLCWPQTDILTAGQILDVILGLAQETALGSNIATLTATQVSNEITGSGGAATGNV